MVVSWLKRITLLKTAQHLNKKFILNIMQDYKKAILKPKLFDKIKESWLILKIAKKTLQHFFGFLLAHHWLQLCKTEQENWQKHGKYLFK